MQRNSEGQAPWDLFPVLPWLIVRTGAGPFTSRGLCILLRRGLSYTPGPHQAPLLCHLRSLWPTAGRAPGDRPLPLCMGLDDLRIPDTEWKVQLHPKKEPQDVSVLQSHHCPLTVTTHFLITDEVQPSPGCLVFHTTPSMTDYSRVKVLRDYLRKGS